MSGQTTAPTINGKPWYQSKTLWFNGLALCLGVAEMQFKLLEQYIPAAVFPALAFVLAVTNVLLRFITTTALTMPSVVQAVHKVEQPAPPAQGGFISFAFLQNLFWVGILAGCLWLVFDNGRDSANADWLKKEAAQAKADQDERDRIAALGRIAAQFEIDEQRRAAERNAYLEGVMNHARKQFPLLARSNVLAGGAGNPGLAGACAAGSVRPGADAQRQPEEGAAPPQIALVPWPVPVDPDLTLGAVWLWNAALTGQAAAPAGACRVDESTGQADPACADSSGLNLDDAWDNHTANARACAEDRARHQRLIDFLNAAERK